jgi:hypothetical protein
MIRCSFGTFKQSDTASQLSCLCCCHERDKELASTISMDRTWPTALQSIVSWIIEAINVHNKFELH